MVGVTVQVQQFGLLGSLPAVLLGLAQLANERAHSRLVEALARSLSVDFFLDAVQLVLLSANREDAINETGEPVPSGRAINPTHSAYLTAPQRIRMAKPGMTGLSM